ncbi:MAG: hypothetical protein KUG79_16705 [Pseudomonadales bacterium]|nr:hypothetical protein [Pseudomonadales bacterium]
MLNFFRKRVRPGALGVEVSPYGIAVARVSPLSVNETEQDSEWTCECEYIEGANLAENGVELKKYIAQSGLEKMSAQVVLHPTMYDIYFIDRPEVEDNELDQAVRWKIKDLVDRPLNELVVDAFGLPSDAYRGSLKKVYAVTTEKAALEKIVSIVKVAGVKLSGIDISELAVRNMVKLLHQDDAGAALLKMRNTSGMINLSHAGDLYLTRNIESGLSMLETGDDTRRHDILDDMLLEIQRSLDYYDSQLGKGAVRNFLIAPSREEHHMVNDYLVSNLGLKVQTIDLNEALKLPREISVEMQSNCFTAVGAAYANYLH